MFASFISLCAGSTCTLCMHMEHGRLLVLVQLAGLHTGSRLKSNNSYYLFIYTHIVLCDGIYLELFDFDLHLL